MPSSKLGECVGVLVNTFVKGTDELAPPHDLTPFEFLVTRIFPAERHLDDDGVGAGIARQSPADEPDRDQPGRPGLGHLSDMSRPAEHQILINP